MLVEA